MTSGFDDEILDWMWEQRIPLSRENYLDLAFLGNPPDPLSAEFEADMPEEFQSEEFRDGEE